MNEKRAIPGRNPPSSAAREGKPPDPPWRVADLRRSDPLNSLWPLPSPIAQPVDAVLAEPTAEGRTEALLVAFLCLTRFLALVSLAWFASGSHRSKELGENFREKLSGRMGDGSWIWILRKSLEPYRQTPLAAVIPELVSFYFNPLDGGLTSESKKFEGWVEFRNTLRHRNRVKRLAPPEILAAKWWDKLTSVLMMLGTLCKYDLVQPLEVTNGGRVITSVRLFRGPSHRARVFEGLEIPVTVNGVEPRESILLSSSSDPPRQLLLSPLLRVGANARMQVLDQLGDRRGKFFVNYVAAESGFAAESFEEGSAGERTTEEVRLWLARLSGRTPREPQPAVASGSRERLPYPVAHLFRRARAWSRDGYSYDHVLSLKDEEDFRRAIDTKPLWEMDLSTVQESYFLLAALHFRLSWRFWAQRNRRNRLAIERVLAMLDEEETRRYHRPRMRGLVALEIADPKVVESVLEGGNVPASNVALVRTWVLTRKMKHYLAKLASRSGPFPMPLRAAEVLAELQPSGGGGIDLPIDPEAKES